MAALLTRLLAIPLLVVLTSADALPDGPTITRLSAQELRACYAAGGLPGMIAFNAEGCIRSYKDAGKICTNGNDCEGECISTSSAAHGTTKQTGICEAKTGQLSCRTLIVDGAVSNEPCA